MSHGQSPRERMHPCKLSLNLTQWSTSCVSVTARKTLNGNGVHAKLSGPSARRIIFCKSLLRKTIVADQQSARQTSSWVKPMEPKPSSVIPSISAPAGTLWYSDVLMENPAPCRQKTHSRNMRTSAGLQVSACSLPLPRQSAPQTPCSFR